MLCGDLQGTLTFYDNAPNTLPSAEPNAYFLVRCSTDGEFENGTAVGSVNAVRAAGLCQRDGTAAVYGEFECGFSDLQAHYNASGIFIATRKPFFFYLYKTGTGERVQKDLDLGTESRAPITSWGLDSGNLWQQRLLGGGTAQRNRSWVPLRNEGSKTHWVMESEVQVDGSGETVLIKPRVNYYLDTGKAVPPATQAMPSGMVYLGEKPKLPR